MNELDAAIGAKLVGGASLTALLATTASVFNTTATRGAALPYVLFSFQGGGDETKNPQRYVNEVYLVKGVAATKAAAGAIAAEIDALMHMGTLTVTGWTQIGKALRESEMTYSETTPEGGTIWHSGGEYRIRLCKPT